MTRSLEAARAWTPACEVAAERAARGFYWLGPTHDDVLQEARIGVAKALRDWDPTVGTFEGFAFMCGRRQVLTALKLAQAGKHSPLNDALALDRSLGDDDDGDTLHDRAGHHIDPARIVAAKDEVLQILRRFDRLTAWERECVQRVVVDGEPYTAVGEPKRVDNALQRARRKLAHEADPTTLNVRTVYVDRNLYATERAACVAAVGVAGGGRVVSIAKRKLLDGRDRAPQGRPTLDGRRGQPVWRVDIRQAAAA